MKTTLAVKLAPDPEQHGHLLTTMERFNAACDAIAAVAFAERCANKIALQKIVYYDIRRDFGLSAQLTVRAISKVVEAYKRDKTKQPRFRPHGGVPYDERIMSWKGLERVSLLTLAGRQIIPVVFGPYQAARLDRRQGQADLVYRDGAFFLYVTLDIPEPPPTEAAEFLGIDLGIVNLATDSDGTVYSGRQVNGLRRRHRRTRARLQRIGSKSAKRLLKRRSRKEARFSAQINHTISKRIVATAKGTNRGIALEDLTHIRTRVTARKPQRATLHSWSFSQLRQFIAYKARLAGVRVVLVDPRNTSRTCPRCGLIDKGNRPSQDRFLCQSCNFAGLPDYFAALIIRRRAAVNQPDAAGCPPKGGVLPELQNLRL